MFSFSFGSFGDILAIANLALCISKTLSESTGSSVEYQELITELDAVSNALHGLHEIVSRQPLQLSVQNTIKHALSRCWNLMDSFMARIAGYQSSLRKGGSGSRWKDTWRKVGWGMFKKEELVALKTNLSEQKSTIIMMLALSHTTVLDRVERVTRSEGEQRHKETLCSLQTIARDTEITRNTSLSLKHQMEIIEVIRSTAKEQTPLNMEAYMDNFTKGLADEVRLLLGEVGKLREERRTMQYEIGELIQAKSRYTSDGPFDPLIQDPLAQAQAELSYLMLLKSKYGPGGEYDPDWHPPSFEPPTEPEVDAGFDPASSPTVPAWRNVVARSNKRKKARSGSPPAPPSDPVESHWSGWTNWNPDLESPPRSPSPETLVEPSFLETIDEEKDYTTPDSGTIFEE